MGAGDMRAGEMGADAKKVERDYSVRHGDGLLGFMVALVLALALALAPLGGEARAQGSRGLFPSHSGSPLTDFFSMLFGGRPSYRPSEQPRIVITPRLLDGAPTYSGGGHGFCVRTCDGRYFPLPGRAGGESDLAQCAAFCPAAKMTVVSTSDPGRGIDGAVTREGKPYSELPNAYAYRQRLVDGCTCNGKVGGLTHVNVMDDTTLRRGDVVMTAQGGRVFTGKTKGPPYRDADFVEPSRFPDLPRSLRARIDELTVASR